jgi:hypothetical protein
MLLSLAAGRTKIITASNKAPPKRGQHQLHKSQLSITTALVGRRYIRSMIGVDSREIGVQAELNQVSYEWESCWSNVSSMDHAA